MVNFDWSPLQLSGEDLIKDMELYDIPYFSGIAKSESYNANTKGYEREFELTYTGIKSYSLSDTP